MTWSDYEAIAKEFPNQQEKCYTAASYVNDPSAQGGKIKMCFRVLTGNPTLGP
jgi:hypothetical protein